MLEGISILNKMINDFIWGYGMCVIFVFTGIYYTIGTRFFQVSKFKLWWSATLKSVLRNKEATVCSDEKSISQFQATTTSLAATVGTGNIVGVATAIVMGGAGAIFWMWISALFGMMTKYGEIVLSMKYRRKNKRGNWIGGPMITIEHGLNCKWLAMVYAFFCLLASFGIGNLSQSNSMSTALNTALNIDTLYTGIITAILVGIVIIGGIQRIGKVTEKFVPLMSIVYIVGCMIVIVMNFKAVPEVFMLIFSSAFGLEAVGGGVLGYTMSRAIRFGVSRGVFSNEAGLGASSIVHCASSEKNPVKQGMWGICEVFIDTFVICSITAFMILTTNVVGTEDINGNVLTGAALAIEAFSTEFGIYAGVFISVCITFFAFSTLVGWSFYGEKAVEYLVGYKYVVVYKIVFVLVIVLGAVSSLELVWEISDTFNGLMAIPNLVMLILLSGEVFDITKKYNSK